MIDRFMVTKTEISISGEYYSSARVLAFIFVRDRYFQRAHFRRCLGANDAIALWAPHAGKRKMSFSELMLLKIGCPIYLYLCSTALTVCQLPVTPLLWRGAGGEVSKKPVQNLY